MRATIKDIEAKDSMAMPCDQSAGLPESIGISKTLVDTGGIHALWGNIGRRNDPFIGGEAINGVEGVKKTIKLGESRWNGVFAHGGNKRQNAATSYRKYVETGDGQTVGYEYWYKILCFLMLNVKEE